MKALKTICVVVVLFSGFRGFAQDVIITQAGEQIRAKIVEVTDDNVSYKKYHDQEGATFVLGKDKIKIISWENGDVDEYKEVALEQDPPVVKETDVFPYIDKRFGTFYLDNGQVYDGEQFKQFLVEKNLSHIWTKYSSGKNLQIAGWGVIGGGFAIGVISGVLMSNYGLAEAIYGLMLTPISGVLLITGIPIAIVGTVKKNNAISDYNNLYGGKSRSQYSQNITIKAGCVGNGVGFSLNF